MKATGNVTMSKTLTLTLSFTDKEIEVFENGCLALAEPDAPITAAYLRSALNAPESRTLFAAVRESIRRALK